MAKAKKPVFTGMKATLTGSQEVADIQIKYTGQLYSYRAFLNGVMLTFGGSVSRRSVAVGVPHVLAWHVRGTVGQKWGYTVTADEGFETVPSTLTIPGRSFKLENPIEETPPDSFVVQRKVRVAT
jgi:hypothetical protein